jgi:zinc transport system permease protein
MMIVLVSFTVVLMVTVVGIVMVIALLTIPAATAGLFSNRLKPMMLIATLLVAFFHISGLAVSYQADLPTGATTIIIAGACYTGSLMFTHIRKQISRARNSRSHTSHSAENES